MAIEMRYLKNQVAERNKLSTLTANEDELLLHHLRSGVLLADSQHDDIVQV